MNISPDIELIYVGDPMCSWCWGFSPVLDGLGEQFAVPLRTMVGGLRAGPYAAEEMDDRLAKMLAHHWHEVEKASGQPFDHAVLERRGWSYDTEPPCVAVVTMRERRPDQTRAFFDRLHRGFYAEGVDITNPKRCAELAVSFGEDPEAFREAMASEAMRKLAWQDFTQARKWGVHGFPTLLLRDGNELATITRGFAPLDVIAPALRQWFEERLGPEAAGEVCIVGEPC